MKSEMLNPHYETPDALRHDAHTLVEDARGLLVATSAVTDEKVAAARERLAAALESGKQTYARLQETALEGAKVADEAVRKHPYESVAVAFGLGALVGCLLSRRS
jgi:ElaB/YqjD/DUF883 family membrane-anchored ribosome-binding protein